MKDQLKTELFQTNYTEIFDDSYSRIHQNMKEFIYSFYEFFLAQSDEIRVMFQDVEMENQRNMLINSFESLVTLHCTRKVNNDLARLASVHKNMDIDPSMYDDWMEALMMAVKSTDEQYNREVEIAWRMALAPGIQFMKHPPLE